MPSRESAIGLYTFASLFVFMVFSLGSLTERHQTTALLATFFIAFVSYLFLLQQKEAPRVLFYTGLIARLALFVSMPDLSDDVYRFIWDGTLLHQGLHPFAALPTEVLAQQMPGLDEALYAQLNSPDYFTVYPPLNQALFWISTAISTNWLTSTNLMRTVLLMADVGALFLMKRLLAHYGKERHLAYYYFLNPLLIIEAVGNVHFEGIVIFFLLLSMYAWERGRGKTSAFALGMAVGTKLLPLIYFPFLFLRGLVEKKKEVVWVAGLVGMLTFLPLANEDFFTGMRTSLDLYFRKFEFNASFYAVARAIGEAYYGYNNIAKIGPLLSLLSLGVILVLSLRAWLKKSPIPQTFLFILSAYLLFATTVHPWYMLPLIALGLLSGYWYPILWSFMIFLTYAGYTTGGFVSPDHVIILEYLLVGMVFVMEYWQNRLRGA